MGELGQISIILEAEIDLLVYKLYGLIYAEVLLVDEGFEMGEEEMKSMKSIKNAA